MKEMVECVGKEWRRLWSVFFLEWRRISSVLVRCVGRGGLCWYGMKEEVVECVGKEWRRCWGVFVRNGGDGGVC